MIAFLQIEWLEEVGTQLRERFGEQVLAIEQAYDFPVIVVEKKAILEVLGFLKNDPSMGYTFLTTLCGMHMPEHKGQEFAIVYQLHNMQLNRRLRIKIFMSENDLNVPSATSLWPTANWMERQEYDFFGFNFVGHPDLRRILNMDEMNYHPMRKQYPLEDLGRHDKDDSMFGR
ncbi:MAG: NADH-quinone oxidoreductase subunit C [Saprospiraceae bacterium]|nr:NADH-quinone oxidoreductase subunit C [Saprospiraceae bacterium]